MSATEEVGSSDLFWAGVKSDLLLDWPVLLGYLMSRSYQWLSGFVGHACTEHNMQSNAKPCWVEVFGVFSSFSLLAENCR